MSDLIGRTIGHYRIVEQIGAGGMGVVYRAHEIADARIELHALFTDEHYPDEAAVPAPSRAGWHTWLPWGLTTVLAALSVAILVVFLRSPPSSAMTKVLVGVEPAKWLGSVGSVGKDGWKYEDRRMSRTAMALSLDGRLLVFSAHDALMAVDSKSVVARESLVANFWLNPGASASSMF